MGWSCPQRPLSVSRGSCHTEIRFYLIRVADCRLLGSGEVDVKQDYVLKGCAEPELARISAGAPYVFD